MPAKIQMTSIQRRIELNGLEMSKLEERRQSAHCEEDDDEIIKLRVETLELKLLLRSFEKSTGD